MATSLSSLPTLLKLFCINIVLRVVDSSSNCLSVHLHDSFGDGWDNSMWYYEAPDEQIGFMSPNCSSYPTVKRVCGSKEGFYYLLVQTIRGDELPVNPWEIWWTTKIEATGETFTGGFNTSLVFYYANENFHIVHWKNLWSNILPLQSCGSSDSIQHNLCTLKTPGFEQPSESSSGTQSRRKRTRSRRPTSAPVKPKFIREKTIKSNLIKRGTLDSAGVEEAKKIRSSFKKPTSKPVSMKGSSSFKSSIFIETVEPTLSPTPDPQIISINRNKIRNSYDSIKLLHKSSRSNSLYGSSNSSESQETTREELIDKSYNSSIETTFSTVAEYQSNNVDSSAVNIESSDLSDHANHLADEIIEDTVEPTSSPTSNIQFNPKDRNEFKNSHNMNKYLHKSSKSKPSSYSRSESTMTTSTSEETTEKSFNSSTESTFSTVTEQQSNNNDSNALHMEDSHTIDFDTDITTKLSEVSEESTAEDSTGSSTDLLRPDATVTEHDNTNYESSMSLHPESNSSSDTSLDSITDDMIFEDRKSLRKKGKGPTTLLRPTVQEEDETDSSSENSESEYQDVSLSSEMDTDKSDNSTIVHEGEDANELESADDEDTVVSRARNELAKIHKKYKAYGFRFKPQPKQRTQVTLDTMVDLSVAMYSASGEGWYEPNYEGIMFHIADETQTELLAYGTLANGSYTGRCDYCFDQGSYIFRVASNGIQKDGVRWSFCNTNGSLSEQLSFHIRDGSCIPDVLLDLTTICEDAFSTVVRLRGQVAVTGFTSEAFVSQEEEIIAEAIAATIPGWETENIEVEKAEENQNYVHENHPVAGHSTSTYNFEVSFAPKIAYEFSGITYDGMDELIIRLSDMLQESIISGKFIEVVQTLAYGVSEVSHITHVESADVSVLTMEDISYLGTKLLLSSESSEAQSTTTTSHSHNLHTEQQQVDNQFISMYLLSIIVAALLGVIFTVFVIVSMIYIHNSRAKRFEDLTLAYVSPSESELDESNAQAQSHYERPVL
eukprot:gene1692-3276_t